MSSARRGLAPMLALMSLAASAQAILPTGPDLRANGWQPIEFHGRALTRFEADGPQGLRIVTENSSSMLSRGVRIDPATHRCLTWRWRVDDSTIPPTDLGKRGGDDRDLIVSLGFAFDPDNASLGERVRHALARQQAGRVIPGHVLFYVWGGAHARNAWVNSPYMDGAGAIRVIENSRGELQRWHEVAVDFAADFRARFDRPVPLVIELAIGADSDDTRSRSSGRIADLSFKPGC